jgi:RNA polymerase sigma factor (TIGR02999 family)
MGVAEPDPLVYSEIAMVPPPTELTLLLDAVSRGEACFTSDLLPAVYAELRRVAAAKMARETPGHTLQPTALVHEAWLRLQAAGDQRTFLEQVPDAEARQRWENRAHFFSAAAEAMSRILIESARRKKALRHGGGLERVDVADVEIAVPTTANEDDLLAVHEALTRLASRDPQKAELVKLRYFIGLSVEESAEILGISTATAKRYWAYSRAWLYWEIRKES